MILLCAIIALFGVLSSVVTIRATFPDRFDVFEAFVIILFFPVHAALFFAVRGKRLSGWNARLSFGEKAAIGIMIVWTPIFVFLALIWYAIALRVGW